MKEFNAKEVKDQVVQWIRDWFEENGPGCNAVLGVSGGKDSSVVAALGVEALGKDRHRRQHEAHQSFGHTTLLCEYRQRLRSLDGRSEGAVGHD